MKKAEIEKRMAAAEAQLAPTKFKQDFLEGYRRMLETPAPVARELKRQLALIEQMLQDPNIAEPVRQKIMALQTDFQEQLRVELKLKKK